MKSTPAGIAALVIATACASAPPADSRTPRMAPVVTREALVGCAWEQLGEVREEERSSLRFNDDGELRRAIGRAAARRGATVVIDFKSIRMVPVVSGSSTSTTRPRGSVRLASGIAVRIDGGSCPAVAES